MQQLLLERIRHRSPFTCVLLVFSYVMASKISLIYVQSCEKRKPTQIHKHGPKIKSRNLNFVILNRYLDRQLSVEPVAQSIERCRGGVEPIYRELSRAIKELSRGQKFARSIDLAIERYLDCDEKKLKSSIDSLAVERCQAIIELQKISTSSLISWTDLHGFNTRLELLFFEVLNISQIYPITSKVRFVKGLANYIKQ